ncbi:D-serine ammonia-lyase [Lagierella sp. ICN-221743]
MDYLEKLKNKEEFFWKNPKLGNKSKEDFGLSFDGVIEAELLLKKFAPFIMKKFPETVKRKGIIESELTEIPNMKKVLIEKYKSDVSGKIFLKQDNELAVAGSVKARGGIYEILKYAKELLVENKIIEEDDDYSVIASEEVYKFLSKYTVQVGSTGNLGLSIGIISRTLGFKVVVHMSRDAAQWKKDLLRSYGAEVIEYEGDYGKAVERGRKLSEENPYSYFVDDENSKNLFYGYAVAAIRLEKQLEELNVKVDEENPLFVYIPCGVGGAPGGIAYGLKEMFGENVHIFFIEPTNSPCMLLGMASGKHRGISVFDIGLSGLTQADGLAVARPSGFVGKVMDEILSGVFTIDDEYLFEYMKDLYSSENIFIEPSAASTFQGVGRLYNDGEFQSYITENIKTKQENIHHILWSTGGSLVPMDIREKLIKR